MPELPELQMVLPLEKFGMGLTRQHVSGDQASALAALDLQCHDVLASPEEWVLSLAVSPEEQQLLDSLKETQPLARSDSPTSPTARMYPLQQPTGRAGVLAARGAGAAGGRRLLCWGFILPEGEAGYTVWFARPREKLPRTAPTESHAR